jgi:hypothetical protein
MKTTTVTKSAFAVPRIAEVQYPAEPHVSYGLMDNFNQTAHEPDYMAGVASRSRMLR